jgi:hypothetical protein
LLPKGRKKLRGTKQSNAAIALEKAMEVRRVWMQALSGKISKKELDAKGIRFMAVAE